MAASRRLLRCRRTEDDAVGGRGCGGFGSIASFVIEGDTEITYWIDRSVWGQGLASAALTLFLREQRIRPLHARAAGDNAASIRVLQKAGFRITGTEISYANARGAEIEETILRLD
jgi:RimJ/RimL family protein N-acetyltransferase